MAAAVEKIEVQSRRVARATEAGVFSEMLFSQQSFPGNTTQREALRQRKIIVVARRARHYDETATSFPSNTKLSTTYRYVLFACDLSTIGLQRRYYRFQNYTNNLMNKMLRV